MRSMLLFCCLLLMAVFAGCPQGDEPADGADGDTAAREMDDGGEPMETPEEVIARDESSTPEDRGRNIYMGLDYSNTGLTCAHCHATMPQDEQNRIFIAHSGYGAARRGAWKITSQEQLAAGKGNAETLIDAANVCVKAPYMDHGEQLIEGEDAAALQAYMESIAVDDEPFVIAKADSPPPPGLTPDKENGKLVYNQSCMHCHDAGIDGLPKLVDASEWLNPLQVMAKIRKLPGDWYNDYEGVDYMNMDLQSAGGDEVVNPCNPCGDGEDEQEAHEEHEEHGVFKEGAMPFYGTDILTDQQVVDVAHYVAEEM